MKNINLKFIMFILWVCMFASCASETSSSDIAALQNKITMLEQENNLLKEQLSSLSVPDNNSIDDNPNIQISDTQIAEANSANPERGKRSNPYILNDTVILNKYDGKFEVTFYEVIRGDEANKIAIQANQFNILEDGQEFYIAKLKIKAIDAENEDVALYASDSSFDFYNEQGSKYSLDTIAGIENSSVDLFVGAEAELWLNQVINIDDNVNILFDDREHGAVWFNLN